MHLCRGERGVRRVLETKDGKAHLNSVHSARTRAEDVGFFERWTSLTLWTGASGPASFGWTFQTEPWVRRERQRMGLVSRA